MGETENGFGRAHIPFSLVVAQLVYLEDGSRHGIEYGWICLVDTTVTIEIPEFARVFCFYFRCTNEFVRRWTLVISQTLAHATADCSAFPV